MSKFGDVDTAMDLIEPLVGKISGGWAQWIDIDNSLDPILDHPRFQAFRDKLKALT
jgi:hypothetical protein